MARLALIVYLTLAASIGPALCCCTARESSPQGRGCCRQQHDATSPSSDGPARHCPCQEQRSIAAVLGGGEGLLFDAVRTGHIAAFAAAFDWFLGTSADLGKQALHVLPGEDGTLFGRDILRALYAMRC